jgi:hypothetical protein
MRCKQLCHTRQAGQGKHGHFRALFLRSHEPTAAQERDLENAAQLLHSFFADTALLVHAAN